MQKISATRIHTVSGEVLNDTVLIIDESGKIEAIEPSAMHDPYSVQWMEGDLVPGFINAHCHLELSHMKGRADTGTKLLPFLKTVVQFREFPEEVIQDAVERADHYMYEQGIMAVGDISNKTDSFHVKAFSKIRYYTFVEFFDLMQPGLTDASWQQYHEVYQQAPHEQGNRRACTPHAAYSVTPELFKKLYEKDLSDGSVSIHNQETEAENHFLMNGTGAFVDFYKGFGMDTEQFQPTGKRSIHYALQYMHPHRRTLFVHNTVAQSEDFEAALQWSDQTYWVTCPNANLYIENQLPNYAFALEKRVRMCIGTDSLTSNWQLSIFEEMKTIQKYQSFIPFEILLQWATLNGAQALGFDEKLGSIEVGKSPGLILIHRNPSGKLDDHSTCQRIV